MISKTSILGIIMVFVVGTILISVSFAKGPPKPLVLPGPHTITSGYPNWENGAHGVCYVDIKGQDSLATVYGDIYGDGKGNFTVVKLDGTGAFDCVSAPHKAAIQSWEHFQPLTGNKGGKLDPANAEQ